MLRIAKIIEYIPTNSKINNIEFIFLLSTISLKSVKHES